ncbi:hydantoinase/oxoprolinase family protein [Arthrobacter sp. B6]|uniref:hydantoinase/oxoprolinase family protein n=1 Tax=Arthrobacter sp. B6 TaxID=1570137 RepID=UPI0008369EB8|nr:hydantoinase/oxoprolinase family protein [Arthrobacter sp. B6]
MSFTIGVDVGGTFTDIMLSDGQQSWRSKASTYPQEFGRGVKEACTLVADQVGLSRAEMLSRVDRFGLGTTAVTNVITVQKGRKVGLLTTAGFEDVLSMARGRRASVDGWLEVPWQPVERHCTLGVSERIGQGGVVVEPLNEAQAIEAIDDLVNVQAVEAIAISLLWSFANPVHEDRLAALVRERHPNIPVFSGSGLHPTIREYERTMVAVLNAYCGHALDGISDLAEDLEDEGLAVPMMLLQANGGLTTLDEVRRSPFSLNASGPAAGVMWAAEIASKSEFGNVICGDTGGTSFDVALIREGRPERTQRKSLHGAIVAQSTVDIESIGAGGGSIAWVDERGLLRVGPESARAYPGPACYGRGGVAPTITDAMLVLGYIDPLKFLGGAMPLDVNAALRACGSLGEQLGLDAEQVALGIHSIAVQQMGTAARLLATSSGLDPSSVVFLGYGGAGPLFAGELAAIAGLPTVLVPLAASVLSAGGAASVDVRSERILSVNESVDKVQVETLMAQLKSLGVEVDGDVARTNVPEHNRSVMYEADMRFQRQAFELTIPIDVDALDFETLKETFIAQYSQRYGRSAVALGTPVEVASVRAVGFGEIPSAAVLEDKNYGASSEPPVNSFRMVLLEGTERTKVKTYQAEDLLPQHSFLGPALVDQGDTTIVVPEGYRATRDSRHSLLMEAIS